MEYKRWVKRNLLLFPLVVASLAKRHRMPLTEPTGCTLTDPGAPRIFYSTAAAAASWTSRSVPRPTLTGDLKEFFCFDLTVDARLAILPAS